MCSHASIDSRGFDFSPVRRLSADRRRSTPQFMDISKIPIAVKPARVRRNADTGLGKAGMLGEGGSMMAGWMEVAKQGRSTREVRLGA